MAPPQPATATTAPTASSSTVHATWLARCLGNSTNSPLEQADLDALLAVADPLTVGAGDVLRIGDDPTPDVYVLERGKVALTEPDQERRPVLHILHPGDVFGDVGLFLGRARAVDATVLEEAQLLRLAGDDLIRLVSSRPRIALRWMVSMAARLADSQDRIEQLLAGPLDLQLATLLGHAADSDGVVAISQDLLARLLGVRRPSVARSLANLQRRGLIEKRYRHIHLIDPERLQALTARPDRQASTNTKRPICDNAERR